jgi:thiamine pyrophosphokinase
MAVAHPASSSGQGSALESPRVAVIVLNQPVHFTSPQLRSLWQHAQLRICADGGANRLAAAFDADWPLAWSLVPVDAIVGDLDSMRPDVGDRFGACFGTRLVREPSQDDHDLSKAMRYALVRAAELGLHLDALVVLGGSFSARFDHVAAALSAMLRVARAEQPLAVVLRSEESLVTVLLPGTTTLLLDRCIEGPSCGLLPLAGPATVTTDGLVWNLHGQELCMGALVSSSNAFAAEANAVTVTTDAPIFWTSELRAEQPPIR